MLLACFGADVIKVEPPDGAIRCARWRTCTTAPRCGGTRSARNKRCITADLRQEEARALIRRLVEQCDVVVENFRPGRMEEWGLGYDALKAINPRLDHGRASRAWARPDRTRIDPGFAAVAEGMGGLRYVNGFPDRPPVRANLSLGDTIGGLHAVIGLAARAPPSRRQGAGEGQVVDVAIYESIFNLMESTLPEYATAGVVRERHGSTVSGIVPTNMYPLRRWPLHHHRRQRRQHLPRLMRAIDRADLAEDARLATNHGRVPHEAEIDEAIEAWTSAAPYDEVLAVLEAADVPAGPIYSVADQLDDPHFVARGLIEHVTVDTGRT